MLYHCQGAVGARGGFDLLDEGRVVGDEVDGTEEIGSVFRLNAGMLALGGEADGFEDLLCGLRFCGFEELLFQSGCGCVFGSLVT